MSRDRMETVLRLRQLRERELRVDLGAATRRVADSELALHDANERRSAHRDSVHDVASLQLARSIALHLQHEVEVATSDLQAARAAQQRALEAWQVARAEERAVERLVERRRAEARREQLTAELAQLDELALLGSGGAT